MTYKVYINYDAVIVSINIFTAETVPILLQIPLLSMTGILLKITDIRSILLVATQQFGRSNDILLAIPI